MNVVDKLVKEWAWRCDKGYPDINNPKDKAILDRLLKEWGVELPTSKIEIIKEEAEDIPYETLIDLLNSKKDELTPKQKVKLFNTIKKTGKGLSSTLYDNLLKKGLGEEQASVIVSYGDRVHIEDKILKSLENSSNTFSMLGTEGNLSSRLSSITNINEKYIEQLLKFTTGKGTKAVGRGELALVALLNDTFSPTKGDISLSDGTLVEIKADKKGEGAIVAPDKISRGSSKEPKVKIEQHFSEKDFSDITNFISQTGRWPDRLEMYFNEYVKNSPSLKTKFLKAVIDFVKDLYQNSISITKDDLQDTFSSSNFKTVITKKLALEYLKDKKVMFISKTNDFILLKGSNIENYIGKEIVIGGFSDPLPRLKYVKS